MRKPVLTIVLIFLLGLGVGLVLNHQSRQKEQTEKPAAKAEPDVVATDLELVQGSEGKEQWRMRGKTAQYSVDQRIVQILNPQLSAYVGQDRQEVFIRSDTGEVNQPGNTLTLKDNIAGRYGDFTLNSDVFDYIGAMKKAYFKGRVVVTRPDFTVNATTVEIDLDTKELTAAGGVTAEFVPSSLKDMKKGPRP